MRKIGTAMAALLAFAACEMKQKDAPSISYPGFDAHGAWLPLMGTAHEPPPPDGAGTVTCNDCHGKFDTFTKFECTGCHTALTTDPWHLGITGYAPPVPSTACYGCHPLGQANMTDGTHHQFFPVGVGTKHNRGCGSCHSDPADRKNVAKLNCAKCHANQLPPPLDNLFPPPSMELRHARVKEYPVVPVAADCLRCHDSGQVDRIAAHGKQPGPAGRAGPGDGDHGQSTGPVPCFTCHSMVPPYFSGASTATGVPNRPWAEDWKIATCTPCHN